MILCISFCDFFFLIADPERTPFQWNNEKNAGFSSADKTWLPVADNYKEVNVRKENADEKSHLKVYKSLKELRQTPTLQDGQTKYAALGQQVVAIARFKATSRQSPFNFIKMTLIVFQIFGWRKGVHNSCQHWSIHRKGRFECHWYKVT